MSLRITEITYKQERRAVLVHLEKQEHENLLTRNCGFAGKKQKHVNKVSLTINRRFCDREPSVHEVKQ